MYFHILSVAFGFHMMCFLLLLFFFKFFFKVFEEPLDKKFHPASNLDYKCYLVDTFGNTKLCTNSTCYDTLYFNKIKLICNLYTKNKYKNTSQTRS